MRHFSMEKTVPIRLVAFVETPQAIIPKNYDISFVMMTDIDDMYDIESAQQQQDRGFSKIMAFLTGVVDESLVFGKERNNELFNKMHDFDNNVIVLPEVNEHCLAATMHAKMNAITEEFTMVQQIKIYDKDDKVTYEYILTKDEEYEELPSDDEWMNEFSYWEGCWWNRPDVNTMDKEAESQEEYEHWLEIRQKERIDDLNMETFREIDEAYNNGVKDGKLISVDFENSDAKKGKHVWKPVLVD